MRFLLKIRQFLLLNNYIKKLFIEAFIYLAFARILKSLPFSKIASSLGNQMHETSMLDNPNNINTVKDISTAISVMSRYTFWESQCLVKAIAGMKMLERRSIDSTLYLGTARDEYGKMIAHAWLRSGSIFISGSEGMNRFTPVCRFGKISDEGGYHDKSIQS